VATQPAAPQPAANCEQCRGTGTIVCEQHASYRPLVERWGLFLESGKRANCCRMVGTRFCPACRAGERHWSELEQGHFEWRSRVWNREDGRSQVPRIDDLVRALGQGLEVGSTKHFFVVSDQRMQALRRSGWDALLPELRALDAQLPGSVSLRGKGVQPLDWLVLHLYRCETLYDQFVQFLGLDGDPVLQRFPRIEAFMLFEPNSYRAFEEHHHQASRLYAGPERFAVGDVDGEYFGDEPLPLDRHAHTVLAHRVASAMLSLYFYWGESNFRGAIPRFLDMGIAHWFEFQLGGRVAFFTESAEVKEAPRYGDTKEQWQADRWPAQMAGLAQRRRSGRRGQVAPTFAELAALDPTGGNCTYADHVASWSLINFLHLQPEGGPTRFRSFVDAIRSGASPSDALKRVYDVSEQTATERWHEWAQRCRRSLVAPDRPLNVDDTKSLLDNFAKTWPKSTSPEDRVAAIAALRWAEDDRATENLLRVIAADSEPEAVAAVIALRHMQRSATAKLLVKEIDRLTTPGSSETVRIRLVRAAGAFKEWQADLGPRLAKWLTHPASTPQIRGAVARALGELGGSQFLPELLQGAADPQHYVRAECARAIASLAPKEGFDMAVSLLADASWHVRIASVGILRNYPALRAVPPLIEALGREKGRLEEDIDDALRALTGQSGLKGPLAWQTWFDSHGRKELAEGTGPRRAAPEPDYVKPAPRSFPPIYSKKFVFALDISESMLQPILVYDQSSTVAGSGVKEKPKLRYVAESLVALIEQLEEDVEFDILLFADRTRAWKGSLQPVTAATRRSATTFLQEIMQGNARVTDLHRALDTMLSHADERFAKRAYDSVLDTIYLITDGSPTSGQITDPNLLIDWFAERNRLHSIKVQVVSIEATDTDVDFLRRLAEENHGKVTFVSTR